MWVGGLWKLSQGSRVEGTASDHRQVRSGKVLPGLGVPRADSLVEGVSQWQKWPGPHAPNGTSEHRLGATKRVMAGVWAPHRIPAPRCGTCRLSANYTPRVEVLSQI